MFRSIVRGAGHMVSPRSQAPASAVSMFVPSRPPARRPLCSLTGSFQPFHATQRSVTSATLQQGTRSLSSTVGDISGDADSAKQYKQRRDVLLVLLGVSVTFTMLGLSARGARHKLSSIALDKTMDLMSSDESCRSLFDSVEQTVIVEEVDVEKKEELAMLFAKLLIFDADATGDDPEQRHGYVLLLRRGDEGPWEAKVLVIEDGRTDSHLFVPARVDWSMAQVLEKHFDLSTSGDGGLA
eukprot:TRINITY_DN1347_c0_g1_i1.p1 TRINITY_DN1347_c0_g1~~TRINITY_DN1347_c0_g1_i1.p1  ORF type:complete len:240 (+),score=28.11 TRINITY_DN1347_c0_g1_i1:311-1030(+)